MSRASIIVSPFGIYRLHSEIPLKAEGKRTITRASFVEFDNDRQVWTVTLPSGEEVHTDTSRAKALEWEKTFCENLLKEGYRP